MRTKAKKPQNALKGEVRFLGPHGRKTGHTCGPGNPHPDFPTQGRDSGLFHCDCDGTGSLVLVDHGDGGASGLYAFDSHFGIFHTDSGYLAVFHRGGVGRSARLNHHHLLFADAHCDSHLVKRQRSYDREGDAPHLLVLVGHHDGALAGLHTGDGHHVFIDLDGGQFIVARLCRANTTEPRQQAANTIDLKTFLVSIVIVF